MKHIELNRQGEAIKQFFLGLPIDPDGSIVELDGQAVARVLPVKGQPNGSAPATESWTNAKNDRRCDLIDRKYQSSLTPAEEAELKALQNEMLRYRQRVAPLPLEAARRLHQELLAKAAEAGRA